MKPIQREQLKKHRQKQKLKKNCPSILKKHIKVIRDSMREKNSFTKAHKQGQKQYPIKTFKNKKDPRCKCE